MEYIQTLFRKESGGPDERAARCDLLRI
jgi:hypothetical protein